VFVVIFEKLICFRPIILKGINSINRKIFKVKMIATTVSVKKQSAIDSVKALCVKPEPELEAEVSTEAEEAEVEAKPVKEKKPKKPFLSAKYSKFMVFGYWLIEKLTESDLLIDSDEAHKQLEIFSEIPAQIEFYKNFVDDEFKITQKTIKTLVRNYQKEIKKEQKKQEKKEAKPKVEGGEKKKRGRKAKVQPLPDAEEQLITELVAAAQGSDEPVAEVPVAVEKKKRSYNRKAKTEAVESVTDSSGESGTESGSEKPKRKYTRKAKTVDIPEVVVSEPEPEVEARPEPEPEAKPEPEPEPEAEPEAEPEPEAKEEVVEEEEEEVDVVEEEEEELEVTRVMIKKVEYLLDEKTKQLYDPETYEPIRNLKKNEKYEIL
jgi:hypothetical protein